MKKKVLAIVTAALIGTTAFAATASAASGTIDVISREDGSGTRGAFIELFGIEEKQGDEKVDMTTEDASITNSTSVMMTTVAGDENAIGYISLGSLNDTVKAVKIDGAEASAENVANDTYKVSRPFNIITTDKLSDAAQDFENYIMSADGQQIVEDNGYIKVADDAKAYEQSDAEGKVVVAGSSSVTPVMEKLKEAYVAVNPDVEIEVQQSDSTTGMTSAIEGVCDIGMASRDLKDSEIEKGLTGTTITMDGIAVIVNNDSPVEELSSDSVKGIYTGEITDWADVDGDSAPIVVIGREAGSGTRGAFEELLDVADKCTYASELDSTGAVMAKVASTPGSIGYVSLDVLDDTVKALKLEGVEPTAENIKAGNYFLSRPFVMATKGEISEQSEPVQFDYLSSAEGKDLISSVGLITVD